MTCELRPNIRIVLAINAPTAHHRRMAHTIEILTVQEVADTFGVHKATVNRWIAGGRLLPWRPGGARRPALVLSQVAEQFARCESRTIQAAREGSDPEQ